MTLERGLAVLRDLYPWPDKRPCPRVDHIRPGWLEDSNREVFQALCTEETRCIVELGTWVGLSARYLLDCAPNASCICIDHWRGSAAHRTDPYYAEYCKSLYDVFRMLSWDYRERLYPVREDTQRGLALIDSLCIQPDLIYLDADHRYKYVRRDMETILDRFPGAILVGDDYAQAANRHFAVRRAVNDVVKAGSLTLHVNGGAWYILPASKEES